MTSDEDAVRPRFTLDSDDEGEHTVASVAAALTTLTILPSVSTADASWNKIGVLDEGRLTPAATLRTSSRGPLGFICPH